jgi:alpha-1,4-digalacturonate transport system permease protein
MIIFSIPLIWMVLGSFKTMQQLFGQPLSILPNPFTLGGYTGIQSHDVDILQVLYNTFFVAVTSALITVATSVAAGYALAKGKFRGRKVYHRTFLMTLYLSSQVLMVPLAMILKDLNLMNNLWGLIVPAGFSSTSILFATEYMRSIPNEFIESAQIDGANEFTIFWRIVVPLSKPLIAALFIFSITWNWNNFVLPLIVINDSSLYTIQLSLSSFFSEPNVVWNQVLAFSIIASALPFILFLSFQKLFMQGIMSGGTKY